MIAKSFRSLLAAAMYITFSLGSLPESVGGQNVMGGLFVIGIYEEKPNIKERFKSDGIYITMFEF